MPLKFIHVVAYCRISFSFTAEERLAFKDCITQHCPQMEAAHLMSNFQCQRQCQLCAAFTRKGFMNLQIGIALRDLLLTSGQCAVLALYTGLRTP